MSHAIHEPQNTRDWTGGWVLQDSVPCSSLMFTTKCNGDGEVNLVGDVYHVLYLLPFSLFFFKGVL